jgi:hypothetical protein
VLYEEPRVEIRKTFVATLQCSYLDIFEKVSLIEISPCLVVNKTVMQSVLFSFKTFDLNSSKKNYSYSYRFEVVVE